MYIFISIGGIVTQIAKKTEVLRYTEGVLECFLPDNPESMTPKEQKDWISANNKRMEAICKFLNDNNL